MPATSGSIGVVRTVPRQQSGLGSSLESPRFDDDSSLASPRRCGRSLRHGSCNDTPLVQGTVAVTVTSLEDLVSWLTPIPVSLFWRRTRTPQ